MKHSKEEARAYYAGLRQRWAACKRLANEDEIKGKVAKRKKYYVVLDRPMNGKKSAHLTRAWKKA